MVHNAKIILLNVTIPDDVGATALVRTFGLATA